MGRGDAAAFAGNGIGCKAGRAAFHQVDDLNAKSAGALVDEGKGQVFFSRFVTKICVLAELGQPRHLLGGVAVDLPQFTDAGGGFLQVLIAVSVECHENLLNIWS